MHLTDDLIQTFRQSARQIGSDLDLMLELPAPVDNPALMAAQLTARVSHAMHGRRVDVVISAQNKPFATNQNIIL
ncbi:hypothetical protein [Sulfuriferula sp.]|uniref:hypothetical protein n=1 Tax=Sulfuriferula sp. TaxID=2025307 RepID=UPI0027321B82|nr:hypothetical protein [Sulfuriferula sp.]MDP2026806.1 hypothetical protein [Sulfuriferula sp.]